MENDPTMQPPAPSLLDLCRNRIIYSSKFPDELDWIKFGMLPLELLQYVLYSLSPIQLDIVQQRVTENTRFSDTLEEHYQIILNCSGPFVKRKRIHYNKLPTHLLEAFSAAWQALLSRDYPTKENLKHVLPWGSDVSLESIHCRDSGSSEQLYWESYVQSSLNEAAAQASSASCSAINLGELTLPGHLTQQVGLEMEDRRLADNQLPFTTIKGLTHYFSGFLRTLRIQGSLCTEEVCDLLQLASLQWISFFHVKLPEKFKNISWLMKQNHTSLQGVEFCYCNISDNILDVICEALEESGELSCGIKHISIISSNLKIESPSSTFLNLCRFIPSVTISSNKLLNYELTASNIINMLFQGPPGPSYMHLGDNQLGKQMASKAVQSMLCSASMRKEASLPVINVLDLRSNMLDSIRDLVCYLRCLTHLKRLNISDNPIGDDGARTIAEYVQGCTTCTWEDLDISSCDISCDGISEVLGALSAKTVGLRSLSIADNYLGMSGSIGLARFLTRGTVQSLNMSEVGLGSTGCSIELQKALINTHSLQHLNISKNRIGRAGANLLSEVILKVKGGLDSLDASFNLLDLESMQDLAMALQSRLTSNRRRIKKLDLRGNPGSFLALTTGLFDSSCDQNGSTILLASTNYDPCVPHLHDDDP